MNPSKESVRKARESLVEILRHVPVGFCVQHIETLKDFLDAAEKKLPSEKSFEAERKRRRTPRPSAERKANASPPNKWFASHYHEPSAAHPASCPGCNSDARLWGKKIGKTNG